MCSSYSRIVNHFASRFIQVFLCNLHSFLPTTRFRGSTSLCFLPHQVFAVLAAQIAPVPLAAWQDCGLARVVSTEEQKRKGLNPLKSCKSTAKDAKDATGEGKSVPAVGQRDCSRIPHGFRATYDPASHRITTTMKSVLVSYQTASVLRLREIRGIRQSCQTLSVGICCPPRHSVLPLWVKRTAASHHSCR